MTPPRHEGERATCSSCGSVDDARRTTCLQCGGQMQPVDLADQARKRLMAEQSYCSCKGVFAVPVGIADELGAERDALRVERDSARETAREARGAEMARYQKWAQQLEEIKALRVALGEVATAYHVELESMFGPDFAIGRIAFLLYGEHDDESLAAPASL